MSLNIFVSQRHIQTLQIRTQNGNVCRGFCIDLSVIPTRCDSAFTRFLSKMTNICCWESTRYEKKEATAESSKVTAR